MMIVRNPSALNRPDAISIAEVNIYSERGNWIPNNYGNNNSDGNNGNVCGNNSQNDPNCVNNGPNNNNPSNNNNKPNHNNNNPNNNNNIPPSKSSYCITLFLFSFSKVHLILDNILITFLDIRALPEGRETPVRAATQSATYQNNDPDLAIDGKTDTFSIATSNQYGQHGWWQADLGQSYQVTGLTIVSSHDHTSINSLLFTFI